MVYLKINILEAKLAKIPNWNKKVSLNISKVRSNKKYFETCAVGTQINPFRTCLTFKKIHK